MRWINYDLVILAHEKSVNEFGGMHGVKDDAIHSCIESPINTFNGEYLYPTIEEKVVQCYYMFCKNHCFNDGNKRIAVIVLLYLLRVNSINITISQDELIDWTLNVASGEYSKDHILKLIKSKMNLSK